MYLFLLNSTKAQHPATHLGIPGSLRITNIKNHIT